MQPAAIGWVYFFAFGNICASAPGNWLVLAFEFPNPDHCLLHMKIYTYMEEQSTGI